ncbi:MAG: hypothetical protein RLP44_23865 [Aggregatilineales bacterium]
MLTSQSLLKDKNDDYKPDEKPCQAEGDRETEEHDLKDEAG